MPNIGRMSDEAKLLRRLKAYVTERQAEIMRKIDRYEGVLAEDEALMLDVEYARLQELTRVESLLSFDNPIAPSIEELLFGENATSGGAAL